MNLIYLKTFLTVYELGNFTEAAKQLYVPQPTVSNRIRSLEEELGQELFLKGKKGKRVVELTKAGEIFLPYAKQIIESMEIVKKKINYAKDQNILRLGSSVPPSHPLIHSYIKIFEAMNSNLSFDFVSKNKDILNLFIDRELDFAFVNEPIIEKSLECYQIERENVDLIVSFSHPLAKKNKIDEISLVQGNNLILYSPYIHYFNKTNLAKGNFFSKKLQTNSLEFVKYLIYHNKFITFLPSRLFKNEIDKDDIVSVPIGKQIFMEKVKYYIVFKKSEAETGLIKQFFELNKKPIYINAI